MNLITNTDLLGKLYQTQRSMDKMTAQLSTGQRVNKAADDPSSVIYSTRLTSKINEKEIHLQNIQKAQFILESMQVGLSSLLEIQKEIGNIAMTIVNPQVFIDYPNIGNDNIHNYVGISYPNLTNPNLTEDELSGLFTSVQNLSNTYDDISKNFSVNGVNYLESDNFSINVNTGYSRLTFYGAGVGINNYEGIGPREDFDSLRSIAADLSPYNINVLEQVKSNYKKIQDSLERYEELNLDQLDIMQKDYNRITDADTAKATSELARLQILEENNLMLMQVNHSRNQMLMSLLEL